MEGVGRAGQDGGAGQQPAAETVVPDVAVPVRPLLPPRAGLVHLTFEQVSDEVSPHDEGPPVDAEGPVVRRGGGEI